MKICGVNKDSLPSREKIWEGSASISSISYIWVPLKERKEKRKHPNDKK